MGDDVFVLQAAKRDAAAKYGARSVGLITALGDSITANGANLPSGTSLLHWGPQSYLKWACLQSGGALKSAGVYATGGFTTAQVVATHLPSVIAAKPRPQFCVVHAGTNDYPTLTLAQSLANLTTIYRTLLSAGITPVLTTMLPKQTLTSINRVTGYLEAQSIFNTRYARDNGLPCVDWTTPFLNPADSNWAGYNGTGGTWQVDNTHPNGAGAKVMGAAVATALKGFSATRGLVAQAQFQPGGYPPADTNALLLNDANTNGRPDGMDFANTPANVTSSLVAVPAGEGIGNYYKSTVASGTGGIDLQANATAATVGQRMLFACLLKTSGLGTASAKLQLRVCNANADNWLAGLRDWDTDIPAGSVFAQEFVVPAGMSTNNIRWQLDVFPKGASLAAACDVYVGQVAFCNLTTAGL